MRQCLRRAGGRPANAFRQQGWGLLEVLLLVAVFASLGTAGFLELRQRATVQAARQEHTVLAQADAAVLTFASVHHRLPCPDTDRDGREDCPGGAQKGWLPSTSLILAGADPGVQVGQLRYLVQRGAATYDLAVLDDDWRPLEYDEPSFQNMRQSTAKGGTYPVIRTLADLCQRLDTASQAAFASTMAHVLATPARAVAYALAHPGLTDTAGNHLPFEGVNGAAGNTLEDPARTHLLSDYDDLVRERSLSSLQQALGCAPLAQSIHTVALGLDVVEQVHEMHEENIESAVRAVSFAALGAAMTAVDLGSAVAEGISEGTNAGATAAGCAASLGLAVNLCAAFPLHIASAALAGVAAGLYTGSVATNIAAAAMAGDALALADSSNAQLDNVCPKQDFSEGLQKAFQNWEDAKTELATLKAQQAQIKSDMQADLSTVKSAKTDAEQALKSAAGSNASKVDTLLGAAAELLEKGGPYNIAVATTQNAQTSYEMYSAQVSKYDQLLANRETLKQTLPAEIAGLDAQINALQGEIDQLSGAAREAKEAEKAQKSAQRQAKSADLLLLGNVAALQSERNNTVSKSSEAQAQWIAALAVQASERTKISAQINSYEAAYNALNQPPTASALADLLGQQASAPPQACAQQEAPSAGVPLPHRCSKFGKPSLIEKQIDALPEQIKVAEDRVKQAEKYYKDLSKEASDPPDCKVSSGPSVTPLPAEQVLELLADTDAKGATR